MNEKKRMAERTRDREIERLTGVNHEKQKTKQQVLGIQKL